MAIKKKKLLRYIFKRDYRPLTSEGLQKALHITSDREVRELYHLLESMVKEGILYKTPQGRYGPLKGLGFLVGTLQRHTQGYAFLLPEAPGEADVFIPADKLAGAMHRDRVIVRLVKQSQGNKRREGEVVRVLKRANTQVVGTYFGNRLKGKVIPDDPCLTKAIQVAQGNIIPAKGGDKVLVTITRWPEPSNSYPQGKIVEVLGTPDLPGVDITSIQRKYGFPSGFPPGVLKEAGKLDEGDIERTAREEGRLDLTELPLVTIDGEDARDLDDAVSLERKEEGGYRLGVHIADVSYYVQEGSALDREAFRRGTSVYLPDRVIPMFPPRLSNEICSLNPGLPRLAISVLMDLGERVEILSYCIQPSLIRVKERMTYTGVNSILAGDETLRGKYGFLVQTLQDMSYLAGLLKEKRLKRGALDFNLPEARVKLDEKGRPLEIIVSRGGEAESIIEEFMLLCNEVIATHFYRQKIPFIYRIHESPEEDKLYVLRDFLSLFNLKLKGNLSDISPKQLQKIMEEVKGTPQERIVNYVLLRSLPQARYSDSPVGHFGLATRYYTHFTSPIRRYPDLIAHRILRRTLKGNLTPAEKRRLKEILPRIAQHSSEQERLAMEAERESTDLKKIEFMEGKEGQEFEGTISGVTSFGFFVELENTVEGLVHVSRLEDDYYYFDEKRYTLRGETTGKEYRLGDKVRVRLEKVDSKTRSLDFLPLT